MKVFTTFLISKLNGVLLVGKCRNKGVKITGDFTNMCVNTPNKVDNDDDKVDASEVLFLDHNQIHQKGKRESQKNNSNQKPKLILFVNHNTNSRIQNPTQRH